MARRVLTGTLWSMLGIAALGLTRLVYTAVIGQTGPPARLAEVNAGVSLAFVATFVSAAATGAAASKFLPLTTARHGAAAAAAVQRVLRLWTVVGTVVVVVALALGGRLLLPGASAADVAWVCALATAYSAYTFSKSVLYGHQLPGRYAVLEVGSDVAILVLTVVAVLWLPGMLLAPLVVGYAAFAVGAALSTPRVRAGERPDLGRELSGFVAFTALGIAASQGFFQISMVVAQHLASDAEAGTYAAAMSLVSPAFFAPRAMALAFFPAAAESVGRGDDAGLARQTETLTKLLAVTMIPAFAFAAMLGGPVLGPLFGPEYRGGGAVFALLVLAVLLYVLAVPSVNVLSAYDLRLARIPPLASAAGVVVGTAAWLLLGDRFGATGVAAGYLAGMVVQAGTPLVLALRRLGLSPARLLGRYAVAVAVGIALAAVALAMPRVLVVTVCMVGFGLMYAVLHRRDLADIWGQVRRIRHIRDGGRVP
jgi:O-antigen/teichoic acid export membrane protein